MQLGTGSTWISAVSYNCGVMGGKQKTAVVIPKIPNEKAVS